MFGFSPPHPHTKWNLERVKFQPLPVLKAGCMPFHVTVQQGSRRTEGTYGNSVLQVLLLFCRVQPKAVQKKGAISFV